MDNALHLEWFRLAQMDFYAAAHLMETAYPKPLEIICYHCQQAVEKWLKGILAYHKQVIPRIHALDVLYEHLSVSDEDFSPIRDACLDLTDYGVIVRYPAEIDLRESDAKAALENALAVKTALIQMGYIEQAG